MALTQAAMPAVFSRSPVRPLKALLAAGWLAFAVGCGSDAPPANPKPGATAKADPAAKPIGADKGASPADPAPADAATTPSTGSSASSPEAVARRIMILTNGNSPYWDACRYGLKDAEKDLKLKDAKLSAVLEVNDGTPQGQLDKLRQYGSQTDVAGIGVSAIDASNAAIADELRRLQEQGIQVVTIDSDLDRERFRDARFAFIGTDNLAAGRELGICAKHLRPDGGEYVTFVGRTGAQNAIERIGGFKEGAGGKFAAKDSMADENDLTRARDNVRNAIGNHPELNVLVGIWSYNAPAIVDVVTQMKNRDKFAIVTFDAEPGAIKAMSEGKIDAFIVQNPYQMGYQGVRLLKALVEKDDATVKEMFPQHGEPEGDLYDTGLKVVVPNADSPLNPELFGRKTEFLMLEQFRGWLEKYGLEGS